MAPKQAHKGYPLTAPGICNNKPLLIFEAFFFWSESFFFSFLFLFPRMIHKWSPKIRLRKSHIIANCFFFGPLQKKKNLGGGGGGFIIANWTLFLYIIYTPLPPHANTNCWCVCCNNQPFISTFHRTGDLNLSTTCLLSYFKVLHHLMAPLMAWQCPLMAVDVGWRFFVFFWFRWFFEDKKTLQKRRLQKE